MFFTVSPYEKSKKIVLKRNMEVVFLLSRAIFRKSRVINN